MKLRTTVLCILLCLVCVPAFAQPAQPDIIPPQWPVPDYVQKLLEVAQGELGYTEKSNGVTKYGEWVNDPKAQWCAEYLCWAVDQTDKRHGTQLLKNIYPLYGATNTGLNWFLRDGRYVARAGFVNGWGSQWFIGVDAAMEANAYIPQPGDWVFFSYTPSGDTTHVAMVEHCTRAEDGSIQVNVLEGNNPDKVQRMVYALSDWRILGYGTVHDVADLVLRGGNEGVKVRKLQEKLVTLGLLAETDVTGLYNQRTADAIKRFQLAEKLTATGIANRQTQLHLASAEKTWLNEHNENWVVDNRY